MRAGPARVPYRPARGTARSLGTRWTFRDRFVITSAPSPPRSPPPMIRAVAAGLLLFMLVAAPATRLAAQGAVPLAGGAVTVPTAGAGAQRGGSQMVIVQQSGFV